MGLVSRLQGGRVYLDANVFIYALAGFPAFKEVLAEVFGAIDAGSILAVTSELTIAEVLVIPFRKGDREEEGRCRAILLPRPALQFLPIDVNVLEQTAGLRASTPALRTPDAIHLATARSAGCGTLLTNDHRLKTAVGVSVVLLSEAAR
jgi:predicted nucleic acid-binding protein